MTHSASEAWTSSPRLYAKTAWQTRHLVRVCRTMGTMNNQGEGHKSRGSDLGQLPLARSVRAEALGVTATLRICCFHSAEDPYWTSQCSGSLAEVETAIGTLGAHGRTYHCSRSWAQVQCSSSAVNKAQQQAGLVDSKYEGIHLLQIMGNDAEVAETAPWMDSGATSSGGGCASTRSSGATPKTCESFVARCCHAWNLGPEGGLEKHCIDKLRRKMEMKPRTCGVSGCSRVGKEMQWGRVLDVNQRERAENAIAPCWRQEYEVERVGKAERLVSELGNSGQRKWILDKVESRRDRKVTPRQDP
ncbi:hypothetical protein B0H21DRAFT_868125 [Amylocystis lapponica]|nr:hypothetical protein B0H21DRAFT_868125 [Amylocystis lapponica]